MLKRRKKKKRKVKDKVWKKFLRKHWKISILFVIGIVIAVIGAFLVFLWFKDYAQAMTLVPEYLVDWSVGHTVTFMLHLIFWEFIVIGIPAIVAVGVILLQWWRKLPEEEKKEYKRRGHKRRDSGGFFSFLTWIAWLIKIYTDGNWNTPISSWSFDYLISSCIWAVIWVLVIFGIPIAILIILYLYYELKKGS